MDNTHRGEKKIQAVEPRVCISCQRGHSKKPVFWQFVTALAHGASAYLKVLLCSVCFGYFRLFLIMNVGLFPKLILVANSKSTLESCKEKFRITLGFPIRHQYHIKCACLLHKPEKLHDSTSCSIIQRRRDGLLRSMRE